MNDKDCIVGVQNAKELEKTNMRFDMMIDNLSKAISSLGESMNAKFDELDKKMSNIDNKIDAMRDSIPTMVDEAVRNKLKADVFNIIKWAIVTLGGSIAVGVAVKLIIQSLA